MIGSVYKIVCSQSDICYVGSTFNLLKHRMSGHRSNLKRWEEGKATSEVAIYPYFKKYGPYEFKILLIKQYEVADRAQLLAYETLWINKFKKTCVNKLPPFGLLERKNRERAQKDIMTLIKMYLMRNASNTTSYKKIGLYKMPIVNVAVMTNLEGKHIT
ncbi:TPA: hypothetical protein N0F65_001956 [Lagenidium giganteum]|uniref:GIY-YIG domain-containing protein n=1 Tax=Lagenidium giganteum TaxID=4803 RepID=A0AAV2YMV4_9STRA|nr:TPA: hypothetical protein N0F65_001956 [Lagenidium giganteum]